jgi:hypothetical protein
MTLQYISLFLYLLFLAFDMKDAYLKGQIKKDCPFEAVF